MRVPFLLVLALAALSACVLHSQAPLFSDAEADPIFGQAPLSLAIYEAKDGGWRLQDEPEVKLVPQGRHYLVPDENGGPPDSFYFVPLDGAPSKNRGREYLVQAVAGGEADYGVAVWDGKDLLVSLLECDRLKASPQARPLVRFGEDSCELDLGSERAPGAWIGVFQTLAAQAGPAGLRFVLP